MKKNILSKEQKRTLKWSEREYDKLHKGMGFYEEREYYETLATLLKGKKAVDICCGEGFVEQFAPEVVGVDFSAEALKRAKRNGAKKLVKAAAENLPFKDNEFEISLSAGSLEHLVDQEQSLKEMARVSKVQIIVVHAKLPWLYIQLRRVVAFFFDWKQDQPIENPLSLEELTVMLEKVEVKVIFQGAFNYVDLRWIWRKIPYGLLKIPSHFFVISIKSSETKRRFLAEESGLHL